MALCQAQSTVEHGLLQRAGYRQLGVDLSGYFIIGARQKQVAIIRQLNAIDNELTVESLFEKRNLALRRPAAGCLKIPAELMPLLNQLPAASQILCFQPQGRLTAGPYQSQIGTGQRGIQPRRGSQQIGSLELNT